MEDSFRLRVERVFGSLASSQPSSLHSPWSLTDDEVEKREWKRNTDSSDREQIPCSSSFDGFLPKDRKIPGRKSRSARKELEDDVEDLNDDGGEEQLGRGSSNQSFNRDETDKDEWEIRSSIGLDPTLDNEEEEDEYDKVALGRENAGDRLYMRDVTDHGSFLNSHNVLPNSSCDAPTDPRANHLAARMRLKEDEAAAPNFDSRPACDKTMLDIKEPHDKASEDGGKLKSILKRKDNSTIFKSQKRVRFDVGCKNDSEETLEKDLLTDTPTMESTVSDDESLLAQSTRRVPDYVLNPSKYTRYSFDSSSEINEESNNQACMDLLNLVKRSKPMESGSELEDSSADLPKSITFIPKKKASDAKAVNNSSEGKRNQEDGCKQSLPITGFPVGIAAGETQQSEVSGMEEDEPETNAVDRSAGFQKLGRRYRIKSRLDDSVS